MEQINKEMVKHPGHYNKEGRKECWDEMLEKFGPMAVFHFDILSAYKYIYRAGEKDGNPKEQDMAKVENYIRHAIKIIDDNPDMFNTYVREHKRLFDVFKEYYDAKSSN